MIFYFSGTGNSRWIAERLTGRLKEPLVFIPEAMRNAAYRYEVPEGERVGFVFPVYSWGPPPIVLQFVERLHLLYHDHPYLFFVCSCGDDVGLTQQWFCKALARKGWRCKAGFSVIMPNNYVLLPGFDVDAKEVEVRKLSRAMPQVDEIAGRIAERQELFRCKEGSFPFVKTKLINPLFTKWGISVKKFRATDGCIGCKRCERACPMNNITLVEGRPVWGTMCTSCLACYHICPRNAVQYGKATRKKGQYFHPDER